MRARGSSFGTGREGLEEDVHEPDTTYRAPGDRSMETISASCPTIVSMHTHVSLFPFLCLTGSHSFNVLS